MSIVSAGGATAGMAPSVWIGNGATIANLTVGCWVYVTTASTNRYVWGMQDSGTGQNTLNFGNPAGSWAFTSSQSTPASQACSAGGVTAGQWVYTLCRVSAARNMYVDILDPTTQVISQGSVAGSDPSLPFDSFGVLSQQGVFVLPAAVEEYFMCFADIFPDAASPKSLVAQLAYKGPFSIDNVKRQVKVYNSFRNGLGTNYEKPNDVFSSGATPRTTWSGTVPTLGPACPWVKPDYVRPTDFTRPLIV